jgi:hypothetical protein
MGIDGGARRFRRCAMNTTTASRHVTTSRQYPHGQSPSDDGAVASVFAAVWCRSVGTCWTLELYQPSEGTAHGIITDWITSGVPISQPAPDALARELLADRGLQLFRDSSAGPCTPNRHAIGYVSINGE